MICCSGSKFGVRRMRGLDLCARDLLGKVVCRCSSAFAFAVRLMFRLRCSLVIRDEQPGQFRFFEQRLMLRGRYFVGMIVSCQVLRLPSAIFPTAAETWAKCRSIELSCSIVNCHCAVEPRQMLLCSLVAESSGFDTQGLGSVRCCSR